MVIIDVCVFFCEVYCRSVPQRKGNVNLVWVRSWYSGEYLDLREEVIGDWMHLYHVELHIMSFSRNITNMKM
jgi:hypothetical protein